jgi:type I restriction enzyme M protein
MTANDLAQPIWNIANLLRGEFKPSEYGRVILPFTLLRRLECSAGSRPSFGPFGP